VELKSKYGVSNAPAKKAAAAPAKEESK